MTTRELFGLDWLCLPESLQEALQHGEVFTRRWVVEAMLDMVGYTAERDLADLLIVEPACGAGAFLGPITERLSASCRAHGRSLLDAVHAVEAFDLLDRNVRLSQDLVIRQLLAHGWKPDHVDEVVQGWIRQGDYLLADHGPPTADVVVGNPPYIRLEDVPDARMSAYRSACRPWGAGQTSTSASTRSACGVSSPGVGSASSVPIVGCGTSTVADFASWLLADTVLGSC